VHHVPWSLPARETTVPFAARGGVAFIGGYQHTPNVDAACWLVETVMPLVWRTHPEIQCLLVGSAMPPVVRRLERPSVTILGQVEDLQSSVFDRVRLTVAPLRYGAGVNGKVLESFAAGIPCVMSGVAAEGLALPPLLQRWVASEPAALAALICKLHDDTVANRTTARAGLSMIRRNHADATIDAAMQGAIGLQGPASFTDVAALAM
jgi:glycosyltransferase involved in cell wall biosynthesis